MADWAERLGDAAVAEEEIAYASAFYNIAINWSARERDDLRRRRDKGEKIDAFLSEFRDAQPARKHLAEDPNHPQANQVWGSYLCFVRGKWQTGLPALALAADEDLRQLAQHDLAVADNPESMLALAEQWVQYAEGQQQDQVRHAALAAAKFWYRQATSRLKGADRLRAEASANQQEIPAGFPARDWPTLP